MAIQRRTDRAAKPKKRGQSMTFLGALADQSAYTADNMDEGKLRDLNFKVHPDFYAKFNEGSARGVPRTPG